MKNNISTTLPGAALVLLLGTMNARSEVNSHVESEGSSHEKQDHGAHDDHAFTPLGSFNLNQGWFEKASVRHHTSDGENVVFPFGMAPGFLSRDLFLDYSSFSLEHEDEHEFEIEAEFMLTRRIGIAIGVPYIQVRPDSADEESDGHGDDHTKAGDEEHGKVDEHHEHADGWGDLLIIPRFLISETEHSSTAFNFEIQIPTGSHSVGAGDQVHLAPSLSHWQDFGHGLSLHTQIGVEFGVESDNSELFYALELSKALGNFSLAAQIRGETVLEEGSTHHGEGHTVLSGLVGATFRIREDFDFRAAYLFPANDESELDGGYRVGVIKHF